MTPGANPSGHSNSIGRQRDPRHDDPRADETLVAMDAIRNLVHRYSDAVVHGDQDQWAATWAADAVWDIGKGRRVEGRDAIRDMWVSAMTRFEAVVQTVMNGHTDLDLEAGTGTGRWYLHEVMQRRGGERGLMVGHYDDRYICTADGWRFAERSLTTHYTGAPDLSGEFRAAPQAQATSDPAAGAPARGEGR